MAGSHGQRKSRRRQLKVSHQKNWLVGRYAVFETLKAGKWPVTELYLAQDSNGGPLAEVESLAEARGVSTSFVSEERLTELCHAAHHQGCAARMGPFPYTAEDEFLTAARQQISTEKVVPLIVVCDRIQDTFNFGAILRCCDSMAVESVVVSSAEQATVTPQVARSSAGAVNHVSVAEVNDLAQTVQRLQEIGYLIAAASEKSEAPSWDIPLDRPVALVVGSEANGISERIQEICQVGLRIPMSGAVSSLNAAVAAGILLYEIRRQQNCRVSEA